MNDDEREIIYSMYLAAYERPQPPEYGDLRALLPGASETVIDEAADAVTLGAIHGVTRLLPIPLSDLEDRLPPKDRHLLADDGETGGE